MQGFDNHLPVPKSKLSKPGHGNLKNWSAAMHDPIYSEN